ncbi:PhnB protein [Microbacterium keratanolyticum]|uniref:VOC family protein n=1 Tax=Microbacterium keratanolyticum TaxID=67574 RepID=A0A9W6HWC6_9MICO|nr:VOC family protein [Microbacterium keratanolyticum]MBM7468189.1 PhnB protein [Microbacterium keratanolyticum]GLK03180.1 VOC family protein [Microbacterium keratanolyticum]
MTGLMPYLSFPGNAGEALEFYQDVFGGQLSLFTYEQFQRTDGPPDMIAHGELAGPVRLCGSDAGPDDDAVHMLGMSFALLGTAEPQILTEWFDQLAEDGTVIDPLQKRPWGAHDGQVRDRYGVRWLIGYER